MQCGMSWYAPRRVQAVHPYGYPTERVSEQVCVLAKGHDGDHRSDTNVTCSQGQARAVETRIYR